MTATETNAPSTRATLLVLSAQGADDRVVQALEASAERLEHKQGCRFASLGECGDLALFIHETDPWAVVAIDDESIAALRVAFGAESAGLAADAPAEACGYTLVAVPNFASCMDDQDAKRMAWARLQAAKHPAKPF